MPIWMSGWLARLLAHLDNPLTGISLDNDLGPLAGHTGSVVLHRQKLFTQQDKRRKTDSPKQANTSLKHILAVRSRTTAAAQLLEERISSMNLVNVAMPKTPYWKPVEKGTGTATNRIANLCL